MFELTRRKEGRASNRAAFTDYRSSVGCIYLFIYIYFVCVIKVATHVLDAMDAAIFLEHSEDGYVIILFFGFKYLFLTRSNTHFEARFSRYLFFHYRFVEHVLRRTTSCRAHI